MDFAGKGPVEAGPLPTSRTLEAPLPFLLITTGVERLSGSVHGPMIERWLRGDKGVVTAMKALPDLAEFGAKALLEGDLKGLGELMDMNHRFVAPLGGSADAIHALIARCKPHAPPAPKLPGAGRHGDRPDARRRGPAVCVRAGRLHALPASPNRTRLDGGEWIRAAFAGGSIFHGRRT